MTTVKRNIVFQTKSQDQNRFTIQIENEDGSMRRVYFDKGAKVTSDKELIKKLLQHPVKKRGDFELVTNEQVVAKYLEGEEVDELTSDILDGVTMEGIVELGKLYQASESQPTLIKIEIEGEPITDQAQEILDFYKKEKNKNQVSRELKEKSKEVEEFTNELSTDMKAKEAIEYIETHSLEELENFIPEDEDRKTVLGAYNDKQ